MSHITRDINKVTGTVIGISGKLILYALVILLLAEGITRGLAEVKVNLSPTWKA